MLLMTQTLALETLDEMIYWLSQGGSVAIHDATNTTRNRRKAILDRVAQEPNVEALFIESICNDADVLKQNVAMKLNGPDYVHGIESFIF